MMETVKRIFSSFWPPPFRHEKNQRNEAPVERRVDLERRRTFDQHRDIQLRLELLKQQAMLHGHWNPKPQTPQPTNGEAPRHE